MDQKETNAAAFSQAAWMDEGRGVESLPVYLARTMETRRMMAAALAALPFAVATFMAMLPFAVAWSLTEDLRKAAKDAAGRPAMGTMKPTGFQIGSFEIPQKLLSKLMKMEMSPDNLEKLQKGLDFLFSFVP